MGGVYAAAAPGAVLARFKPSDFEHLFNSSLQQWSKGNIECCPLGSRVLVQQYEGVQRQREFYAPRYDTPKARQSRLPDLRDLLYWNPEIVTSGAAAQNLTFYTGDQSGKYLVVFQGVTVNGLAGSTSFILEVKPAL